MVSALEAKILRQHSYELLSRVYLLFELVPLMQGTGGSRARSSAAPRRPAPPPAPPRAGQEEAYVLAGILFLVFSIWCLLIHVVASFSYSLSDTSARFTWE